MPNDQLSSTSGTDEFLQYLLRCALTAPGAATSPTAGRILARLLVVGAVEGGDDLITPYLVPAPGGDATFEVRNYQPGNLTPTDIRDGMGAAAALKVALRNARESDDGIEVVSRSESGLERCVLVRDSTGDFEFRFASHETMVGDSNEIAAARQAWDATLRDWRAEMPPGPEPEADRPASERRARDRPAGAGTPAGDPGPRDADMAPSPAVSDIAEPTARWWTPDEDQLLAGGARGAGGAGGGGRAGRAAAAAEGGREAGGATEPAGATVETPQPTAAVAEGRPNSDVTAGPGREEPAISAGPDILSDSFTAAMRDAIANLVVEVDFGQVEHVIRKVLDEDHRDMVDPLARRLTARLGESLAHPDTAAIVDIVSQLVPRPDDLAEAVAADVGALLSETVLRRRPGGGMGMGYDAGNVMVGIEELQVRLDRLNDQVQKAAQLLQAVTDHLEAGDRRAAAVERVAVSVDQEMHRLAVRIDEQVSALAATATGGSDLSDGVARLTRKLRQSVAQFDRILLRMDEMVDQGELSSVEEPGPPSRTRSAAASRRFPWAPEPEDDWTDPDADDEGPSTEDFDPAPEPPEESPGAESESELPPPPEVLPGRPWPGEHLETPPPGGSPGEAPQPAPGPAPMRRVPDPSPRRRPGWPPRADRR
ncbi:MAG TPA: hypothetical protein VHT30_03660 [Acidimicrobiales bacterium]|jgi:hypothetical protein|nr:hypothetical protein [Acidimicrobiales bacterium]